MKFQYLILFVLLLIVLLSACKNDTETYNEKITRLCAGMIGECGYSKCVYENSVGTNEYDARKAEYYQCLAVECLKSK